MTLMTVCAMVIGVLSLMKTMHISVSTGEKKFSFGNASFPWCSHGIIVALFAILPKRQYQWICTILGNQILSKNRTTLEPVIVIYLFNWFNTYLLYISH